MGQKIRRKEAARLIGLSNRTLEKYAVTGEGPPYYKLGSAIVYDSDDLNKWMMSRKFSSTSDPNY